MTRLEPVVPPTITMLSRVSRSTPSLLFALLVCTAACDSDDSDASATKTSKPSKRAPLAPGELGTQVADYMIDRWPELDYAPDDCTGPENCFSLNFATVPAGPSPKFWEYTYGVPVFGVQKLFERTGDERYLDYVRKYVDRYVGEDGRIDYSKPWPPAPAAMGGGPMPPNDPTIQDVIQPSMLLFGLYDETHEDKYRDALANTRTIFPKIAKNPAGAFWHKPSYPNQQWLDGIYMSEPFLTRYGAQYADDPDACFETVITQIKLAAEHTFDPETRLYYHAWNGAPDGVWLGLGAPTKVAPLTGREVSPILWARSLAWFLVGTVDVLEYLPRAHAERDALIEIVHNIASGLERFQDPETGLFYQVVDRMNGPLPEHGGYPDETDRPAQPNWLETSSSALFAYGLAKAIRLQVLDRDYADVAKSAWRGVLRKVAIDDDGAVTIRGTVVGMSVGGTYNAYTNADFRDDLTSGTPPAPSTCLTAADLPLGKSPTLDCKYLYVRDNVPQGFGAVLLASSELEY